MSTSASPITERRRAGAPGATARPRHVTAGRKSVAYEYLAGASSEAAVREAFDAVFRRMAGLTDDV